MTKTGNLVIVHYLGGMLAKGYTPDFNQNRDTFQFYANEDQIEGSVVYLDQLKAVFFVKSLTGNPNHTDPVYSEDAIKKLIGMKLKIVFRDGEVMYTTTEGYSPARKGFFVYPLDRNCNNIRIFVNKASTLSVDILR